MEISQHISSTKRYPGAIPLLGYSLNFGQAYSLFTLVKCRLFVPVEMNRDDVVRKQIFASACRYGLGLEQIELYNKSEKISCAWLGRKLFNRESMSIFGSFHFSAYSDFSDNTNNSDYSVLGIT